MRFEKNIDNIPSLEQFISINQETLAFNMKCLGDSALKKRIDCIISMSQVLRSKFQEVIRSLKNEQNYEYKYYFDSEAFFIKHLLASMERLLQQHISYGLIHGRAAIETSIIAYLLLKEEVTFDEIKNGKFNKNTNKKRPISVYLNCTNKKKR